MHLTTTSNRLRFGLALCCLLAFSALGCRGFTFDKPPIHPMQNMNYQTHFGAQQEADFWEDGRSMRPKVDGTVPRGHLRLDAHRHDAIDEDGDYVTELPADIILSEELLARGEERYEVFCTPCHGSAGYGEGVVSARSNWIVPSFHEDRARAMPVGELYHIIANGQGTMPDYRAQIPTDDRWAVAAYLRALQISQGMTPEMLPAELAREQGWEGR